MSIYIIDTETTKLDGEVIDLAYMKIDPTTINIVSTFQQYYKPKEPITYGAMAVHHIIPEDLEGMPSSKDACIPTDATYIIGHNIDYDWKVLNAPENIRRIDTLAIARILWPDIAHTQSALMYFFNSSNRVETREILKDAHSALDDIYICRTILLNELQWIKNVLEIHMKDIEELWIYSEACKIPKIMPFGKYKGTAIKDIPSDYIAWLLKQDDVDSYLRKALLMR